MSCSKGCIQGTTGPRMAKMLMDIQWVSSHALSPCLLPPLPGRSSLPLTPRKDYQTLDRSLLFLSHQSLSGAWTYDKPQVRSQNSCSCPSQAPSLQPEPNSRSAELT